MSNIIRRAEDLYKEAEWLERKMPEFLEKGGVAEAEIYLYDCMDRCQKSDMEFYSFLSGKPFLYRRSDRYDMPTFVVLTSEGLEVWYENKEDPEPTFYLDEIFDFSIDDINRFEAKAQAMFAPVAATVIKVDEKPLPSPFESWTCPQLRQMIFKAHGKRPASRLLKTQLIAIAEGDLTLL